MILRRVFLGLAAVILAGCASSVSLQEQPPVVFVHGNGDTAAQWSTTAAWAIVLNVAAIVFMVPLGLATGAAVRVGGAYGARELPAVNRALRAAHLGPIRAERPPPRDRNVADEE